MCVQHCAQKEPLSRGVELRGIGTTRYFGILARALIDGRLTMDRWPKTAVDRIRMIVNVAIFFDIKFLQSE